MLQPKIPVQWGDSNRYEHRYRLMDGQKWVWTPDPSGKPVFEHNNWFPDWRDKGATDLSVAPQFVGPFVELEFGPFCAKGGPSAGMRVDPPTSPKLVPDFGRARAYRLAEGSPCIDGGVEAGLPFVGAAPDLGAFEFGSGTILGE